MRLAGQMRAGFYPIDPAVARAIGERMHWPEEGAFLDPCCGHGEALRSFVPEFPGYSLYGVELSMGRAEKAKEVLNHVLCTGFEHVRITPESISAAWVNPPFDDELGGGDRVELKFLRQATRLLVPGGIMVLVAKADSWNPQARSGKTMTYLNSYYESVRAFWHPESKLPGYSYTSTAIYIGKKRRIPIETTETLTIHKWNSEMWLDWTIPRSTGPKEWKACGFTDEQLCAMADASPLLHRKSSGGPVDIGRPPLPLKLGHIPMVLASGRFNGVIDDHVARAKISKRWREREVKKSVDKDGEEKEVSVQREEVAMSIKVLYKHQGVAAIKSFSMEQPTNAQEEPVSDDGASS